MGVVVHEQFRTTTPIHQICRSSSGAMHPINRDFRDAGSLGFVGLNGDRCGIRIRI